MSVTVTRIGLSDKKRVAAGTIVVGMWGNNQPVPSLAAFQSALAPYGDAVLLSYLDDRHHVVLTLSHDMTELEVQSAIARSNAGTAATVGAVTGVETVVQLEQLAGDARQGLINSLGAVTQGWKNASAFALWLAKYGLYVGIGIAVIAVIVVLVLANRKKK